MTLLKKLFLFSIILFSQLAYAARTSTAMANEIPAYKNYPIHVQQLLTNAFWLSQKNLRYLFGSADPRNGGMDCSGTIYYLLSNMLRKEVPRQADQLYQWAWLKGKFYGVSSNNFNSFEFSKLKPGDLLFWTGTYAVHRDPPVTHVMLYLGKDKHGQPIMFGASDGRDEQGKLTRGVSLFSFHLSKHSSGKFIGYSCIPSLTCKMT
jgi:hypothetical protein